MRWKYIPVIGFFILMRRQTQAERERAAVCAAFQDGSGSVVALGTVFAEYRRVSDDFDVALLITVACVAAGVVGWIVGAR